MSKKKDARDYCAKYVCKKGGDLHFGGTFNGVNFSKPTNSIQPFGKKDTTVSANLDWRLFHMSDPRRKR